MAKVDANKALNVGKDVYQKGGINIETPSQNLEIDPRSETCVRGKSRLAVGNKQPVSGSGAARRQKDVTWV